MPKSIEIDVEKLRIKLSALNVDFDGLRVRCTNVVHDFGSTEPR